MYKCIYLAILLSFGSLFGQQEDSVKIQKDFLDSLFIEKVEKGLYPLKVLHAEPLYIDLIRDLGARKGEREWNVGLGIADKRLYDEYEALVEYEWAPIDRLGLEVELPFSFYYPVLFGDAAPPNRLNSLKLAGQYSFYVSDKYQTSMALGYLHEFEFVPFEDYGVKPLLYGNMYNPFFIAAKRWGQNFHSLVYTGPQIFHSFSTNTTDLFFEINTNFHYMIDGTKHFIGIEINKYLGAETFDMVVRPQLRVELSDHLLVGIVTGFNVSNANERFSSFIRVIYEPKHTRK